MTYKTLPTSDVTVAIHSIVTGTYLFFTANTNSFKYEKDKENTEKQISMLNGNIIIYMSLGIRLSRYIMVKNCLVEIQSFCGGFGVTSPGPIAGSL